MKICRVTREIMSYEKLMSTGTESSNALNKLKS